MADARGTPAPWPMEPFRVGKITAALLAFVHAAILAYHLNELPPAVSPPDINAAATDLTDLATAAAAAAHPLFTPEQLSQHTTKPILLAILGDVFDVTTGATHYAKGSSYAHFAGRDASRAFATGDNTASGLTDDVSGLDDEALHSIGSWHSFFANHGTYTRAGRVIGRHYHSDGSPTHAFPREALEQAAAEEAERKRRRPQCNSRWSANEGSEVWCSVKSGGIERDWIGVPRRYTESLDPAAQGSRGDGGSGGGGSGGGVGGASPEQCVCLAPEEAARTREMPVPYLALYPGCSPDAERCIKTPPPSTRLPSSVDVG